MEYYSAIKRNTFESTAVRWMNLEPITQSEVSQRKTNTVYQHIHTESGKTILMNLFTGKEWKRKCRE